MRMILLLLCFNYMHSMQEHKHHHHHRHDRHAIDMEILSTQIRDAELQLAYERDEREYNRKKNIALITLATTTISGTIITVVYLLKS